MRILHLSPYYAPAYAFGGVVRALEGLAKAQVSAGLSVDILTSDAESHAIHRRLKARETRHGVDIYRMKNRWPALRQWLNLSTPQDAGETYDRLIEQADVIHCHEFRTMENWLLWRRLAAKKMRKPLLLSPHGTLTHRTGRRWAKRGWDAALGSRLAPLFEQVICLTAAEQEEVQRRWRAMGRAAVATRIIPNGIQPDLFRTSDRAQLRQQFRERLRLQDEPILLYLGRLHRRKGVALLAEAIHKLEEPEFHLLIAGSDDGEAQKIRKFSDERITLLGHLNGEDRLAAWAAADGFALPAVGEGMSMAMLEALAAGLPIICTPECHMPEVAECGAGWLVEPEVCAIQKAVVDWLAARERWPQMAVAGRQLVRERFSWPQIVAQTTTVYRDWIARINSAARS
ncbi:MAG: glycosyltransferase family 4 protein [Chloroflexi bacterium]|nr:glycosyltransferase family 4 protein [Chloroflexota bacterium]